MRESKLSFSNSMFESMGKTILWLGLIAGILDSMAGVVVYYVYFGLNPIQVLQYIAMAIYGPTAMNGGVLMTLVGTFFHFFIAYSVSVVFFFAYPRISWLRENKVSAGLLYGIGIWLVMNLLVIPASNIPPSPFDAGLAVIGIVWHMVLVGLPIALITSKYYDR